MYKESTFLKGNIFVEGVHGHFLHFDIEVKEKPQNVHLKLIFCHVLSQFILRERIHDPVFVTLIAF